MDSKLFKVLIAFILPILFYGQYGITYYGYNVATASYNSSYFGEDAGSYGYSNSFFGNRSGDVNYASGGTFVGANSGQNNTNGYDNTFIGRTSGYYNTTGERNVFLGSSAGYNNLTGSNSIFIGFKAGYSETASNRLYIENSDSPTPLVYGKFDTDQIGLNTTNIPTGYTLAVKDKIITEELKIRTYANWPDYVFENGYQMPDLSEVEKYIQAKGHLKDIPTAEEVRKNGFLIGDMNTRLLKKIEELTLYTIAQQKALEEQKQKNWNLEKKYKELEKRLGSLEESIKNLTIKK
ncbi:hypothetical protein GTQ34_16225 [Muricauda sp. JGD-17]|uniref:Peptidase S74 domain-containing protein n=1 Tax=Flagellimonas ochracea TaxID=2696472 RepID=A0A964WZ56_9FLAO|nr:hypothetical protein [Allomuricauda ochracea]NAY93459.1 hypothetical protein [Allomuricauda ochracea]